MSQSESINELATALAKAQAEMSFAAKDSKNPHFNSKYADLSSVWDAIREPLTKNGLSVVQTIEIMENRNVLVSILMHLSGQFIKSYLPIKTDKDTCQGWGSGITYARRYSLAALVGCVQDDDDGNGAEPSNGTKSKPKPKEDPADEIPVTHEQVRQLHEVADECDPEYIAKVYGWLKDKGVNGFDGINSSKLFNSVIGGMKKNAQIYKAGKNV